MEAAFFSHSCHSPDFSIWEAAIIFLERKFYKDGRQIGIMSELWIPFLYLYCITRVREGAHMNSESCVHTFTTLPRKLPHSQIHAHQRNQY